MTFSFQLVKELSKLFISEKYAILPLIDKLIDTKRYDDLYKLATFYGDRLDVSKIMSTELNCLTIAFYKKVGLKTRSLDSLQTGWHEMSNSNFKGTTEAYEKLKSLLKLVEETGNGSRLGIGSMVHVFLASIQQNDMEYSFEIMLKSKRVHKTLFRNLAVSPPPTSYLDSTVGLKQLLNVPRRSRLPSTTRSKRRSSTPNPYRDWRRVQTPATL